MVFRLERGISEVKREGEYPELIRIRIQSIVASFLYLIMRKKTLTLNYPPDYDVILTNYYV